MEEAFPSHSCSVCQGILKESVTIPCGHSYCLKCINDYWDKSDTVGTYSCPRCGERIFNERPELNINNTLNKLTERLKETTADVSPSQSYCGPEDTTCDVCTGRKRKALKTCLTCMITYCETHFQPHFEFPVFKRHKIQEPTGNLEEYICAKHQKVLEMFCRTDDVCICSLCAATKHKNHDTVTLEMERAGRQSHLEEIKAEMKTRIKEKQKKLEIMENIVRMQSSAERELQETDETFKSLQQSIEKLRSDIIEVIRDHEKSEVRNVKELIEQMEKEVEELKRRDAKLAELSQTDDHIYFLKEFPSLCIPSGDGKTPSITINSVLLCESLRKDLFDLNKSVEEIKGCEFVKTIDAGVDDLGHILQNSRSRNHLLKYSCLLTMDPNTAHRHLCLSEGTRKVTYEKTETPYPDHPDRFDFWPQVLCREALSGNRSYWEVEWSGKWTDIGVAYKRISRKGNSDDCLLGYNDKSWRLICSKSSCTVWYNKKKTKISTPCSHRIGVYLDCLGGSLSFFSISDTINLLYQFNNSFTEPIYAGFGLSCDSSITICHLNPSNH